MEPSYPDIFFGFGGGGGEPKKKLLLPPNQGSDRREGLVHQQPSQAGKEKQKERNISFYEIVPDLILSYTETEYNCSMFIVTLHRN